MLFEIRRERFGPRRKLLQDILKYRRRQLVAHELSFLFRVDETRVLQYAQMTRDRWPGRSKLLRDLSGRERAAAEKIEDCATGRIRECAERVSHRGCGAARTYATIAETTCGASGIRGSEYTVIACSVLSAAPSFRTCVIPSTVTSVAPRAAASSAASFAETCTS